MIGQCLFPRRSNMRRSRLLYTDILLIFGSLIGFEAREKALISTVITISPGYACVSVPSFVWESNTASVIKETNTSEAYDVTPIRIEYFTCMFVFVFDILRYVRSVASMKSTYVYIYVLKQLVVCTSIGCVCDCKRDRVNIQKLRKTNILDQFKYICPSAARP